MRVNKLNGLLALLVLLGATGCKSMPSLTWWKTASNTESPDSTAIAHGAPTLPSEVALQQENAAAPTASGVAAAPYASTGAGGVSPAGYPATSAPAFNPPSIPGAQVASSETSPAGDSANVGSIAMPYNPNSVPPAPRQNTAVAETVTAGMDRYASVPGAAPTSPSSYGMPGIPSAGNSTTDNSANAGVGSRYATAPVNNSATPASPAAVTTPAPSYAAATTPTSPAAPTINPVGDRYAPSTPASYEAPVSNQPAPTQTTTVPMYPATNQNLAGTEPYRPGGTSSYPGDQASQATYNVATRPEEGSTTTATGQEVPNVATPETTTEPTNQRYW